MTWSPYSIIAGLARKSTLPPSIPRLCRYRGTREASSAVARGVPPQPSNLRAPAPRRNSSMTDVKARAMYALRRLVVGCLKVDVRMDHRRRSHAVKRKLG